MRRLAYTLALLWLAAPAEAQLTPWSPERITAGWVFTPSVAFGVLRDSNPTMRDEGSPTTRETVGLVNPRGEIDFNGRRAKFSAGYSGALERYQDLSELTRYDQRGRLDAKYQMTPRLLFQTRHQLTVTPTTDQLELEGLPFTRVGSRMLTSAGGFMFDISPRTVLKAEHMFQWVDFNRDADGQPDFRFLLGGHLHSPTVELEYAVHRHVTFGGLYVYRHMSIDAGEEIIASHRAQGTAQIQLGPTTTVRARAGVDYLSLTDTTLTESGPSYGGGISQRIRGASIDGSYERSLMASFGFGGLTAYQTFRVGATVPFAAGRGFVTGGVTYRRSDPVILRAVLVELDSYWTYASAGYSLARWIRMEGFVTVNRQVSSAQGNVERTRVGIQFVTSKPVRIQ